MEARSHTTQYSDLVTVADDASHARFLFGLFRRDLAPAFEAMKEMLRSLPSEARLQEALDVLIRRRFVWMIKDGTFIDPRELRLSVLCQECGPHHLCLRNESTQHELRELAKEIEAAFVRIQGNGETISQAMIDEKRLLLEKMEKVIKMPPVKDNELFLASTVDHDHPFYDLNAFLLTEAGNALMHQRATIIAREFLSHIDSFSQQLLEALKPDSYQGVF